jgi:hypothetical protein
LTGPEKDLINVNLRGSCNRSYGETHAYLTSGPCMRKLLEIETAVV